MQNQKDICQICIELPSIVSVPCVWHEEGNLHLPICVSLFFENVNNCWCSFVDKFYEGKFDREAEKKEKEEKVEKSSEEEEEVVGGALRFIELMIPRSG